MICIRPALTYLETLPIGGDLDVNIISRLSPTDHYNYHYNYHYTLTSHTYLSHLPLLIASLVPAL